MSHRTRPRDIAAELEHAAELLGDGRIAEAVVAYESVLTRAPHMWRARHLLMLGLMQQGSYEDAAAHGRRALIDAGDGLDPGERAEMLTTVAIALHEAGRPEEALEAATAAAALAPRHPHALTTRARALSALSRVDEAVTTARQLVALDRDNATAHALLGELLMDQGRLASASSSFDRAIRLGLETAEVRNRLGLTRKWLGDVDDALLQLRRAVELEPTWSGGFGNLGSTLADCGLFDEALQVHHGAVELAPHDPECHANLALALLASGQLERGWAEFEWGLQANRGQRDDLHVDRWDGSDPSGGTVLVYREQGVGDEIMFASCLDDLIAEAGHVLVECDPRLVTLFGRSFPSATVRADARCPTERQETPTGGRDDFDVAAPIGSLPLRYRRSLDAFPDRRAFLSADPDRVAQWRAWLGDLGGGPVVGISWRSRLSGRERRLEYTRLTEWGAVFSIPGVRFVNLQYDEVDRELDDATARFDVEIARPPGLDLLNDFEGVAALACSLDAVISPQNTLGHLAGALGVPTLMMGNRFWWNNLGATRAPGSTWYPWLPAVTLLTRDPREPWEPVLAEVGRRVVALAAQPGAGA